MVILTICTETFYPQWKVLYESIRRYCSSDVRIALLYVGDSTPTVPSEVLLLNETVKSNYKETKVRYPIGSYLSTLRPSAIATLFYQGYDEVLCLGADCELFAPLDFDRNYNAVVTPHITSPLPDDGKFPSNEGVSKTGHINGDFLFVRNTKEIVEFLIWWDRVMDTRCVDKPGEGMFYDQSWLNFLPFIVSNVLILRDSRYNVAYWNFIERDLNKEEGVWKTKDGPLVMYQYSGFDKKHPENISKYQNRYHATGDLLEFLKEYASKI